ncbi:MAG TPA: ATP-binding protein [Silvibacterium sp.]|jgi:hypothetical protein|nr:ATP-binding protein [Silvibacterium sp.]
MNQTANRTWEEANQAYLLAALSEVRNTLARFLAYPDEAVSRDEQPAMKALEDLRATMSRAPALETLSTTFSLTSFERKILLMCAGLEFESRFRTLFAAASADQRHSLPTISLALAAFDDAHWSALLPTSPLRYWHLLEVTTGDTLTTSPIRIDECILHYMAGTASTDERLRGLTEPWELRGTLPTSQEAVAIQVAGSWSHADTKDMWPAVQLCGSDIAGKRATAGLACSALGLNLRRIFASAVPRLPSELELLVRLWEREALLSPSGLLLECEDLEPTDAAGEAAITRLIEAVRSPLLISVRERRRSVDRPILSFDVPKPTSAEQLAIWNEALSEAVPSLNGTATKLASQFSLNAVDIQTAAAQALDRFRWCADRQCTSTSPSEELSTVLWDECRGQARPRLEGLAQRIEPTATLDDLVLPVRQKQLLGEIALHVRQRSLVYDSWGFASKGARGLGVSALFAGPSGTGKTMAGEVLANQLRLDLYKVDLSQVVSKYIGETEKNLRHVFDAADNGAAILLFDEADALFGKRSEVKDSHDRYANIEVSYLLQRMEAYRGLAILTTNRREALDPAFLRRIRFVIEFPFPDAGLRAEIWRRTFPSQTPTDCLQIDRLARLNAAGGNIRNIALSAAFLAADAREPVRMTHLLRAARNEFAKLEKPLTDSEIAGWV